MCQINVSCLITNHKTFVLSSWMKEQGISSSSRLKSMAQMFGYELDEGFFELIE
ncbi:MAG: chlororespiratory reduction 6 domain-containing protein [Coleofasciculaceae cyanobacterium]